MHRERCLGLAYINYSDTTENDDDRKVYRDRALWLLSRVYDAGLRDPVVTSALGWLYLNRNSGKCVEMAEATLKNEKAHSVSRGNAIAVLAEWYAKQGESAKAQEKLQALLKLRWAAEHWIRLGRFRLQSGDLNGARDALERALAQLPDQTGARKALAEIYERLGQSDLADKHRALAERLARPPP